MFSGALKGATVNSENAELQAFAAAIPAMLFVTSPAGLTTFSNAGCQDFTGRTAVDLLGDSWLQTLHPEDLPAASTAWSFAVESRTGYDAEHRFRRFDGAYCWHRVHAEPVRGADNALLYWMVTCFDMHHIKERLDTLSESESMLDSLIDAAPIGIGFWDLDLRFRRLNSRLAEINGLSVEAHLGKRPDELFNHHLEGLDEVLGQWRQVLQTGQPLLDVEIRGTTPADPEDERIWREDFFPVRVQDRIIGLGAVVEDVTARKRAIEQLDVANAALLESAQRKDKFLAMLAHELRTPLTPIQTGIDILRRSDGDADIVQRILPRMQRQLAQLMRLVDDLLDITRITRGKVKLEKQAIDLGQVVRDVLEATMSDAGRTFHLGLQNEPLMLLGDEVRLRQVIGNLLHNAVKYTKRDTGTIWISSHREGPHAVLHVQDDGIGISPEFSEKIFDAFEQAETSEGLGLGLTLVRELVEMHGGQVQATSAGIGHGSKFVIYLPLMEAEYSA